MKDFQEVKSSGKLSKFDSGAVRDSKEGKGRFDLLPPLAMKRLAKHFQNGAKVYAPRNWEKGIETHEFIDSGLRHIFGYMSGLEDEDHLIAGIWNLMCCVETQERIDRGLLPKELDTIGNDLNTYFKAKAKEG